MKGQRLSFKELARDRRAWIVLLVAAALIVMRLSGATGYLTLDSVRAHRSLLLAFVERQGNLAAAGYVMTYIVVAALALPGAALLSLIGGFLFGAVLGTALTVTGATIGATLVFLLATSLLGRDLSGRFGRQAQRLAAGFRRDAAIYLFVLRLVPVFPFFLVNLVPAIVGIPLRTFVIATFLGIIPGSVIYSLGGSGLGAVLDSGQPLTAASIMTPGVVAGLVGLAALSLAAIPARGWLLKREAQGE